MFFITLGTIASIAFSVAIPLYYKDFFDGLAHPGSRSLFRILIMILSLGFLNWLCYRVVFWLSNYYQPRVASDLMDTCFKYVHGHSFGFFSNNFTGSLVRKITRFARSFEDLTDQITFNLGKTAINFLIILVVLAFQMWQFALLVVVWSVLYVLVQFWVLKKKVKLNLQRANMDSKTTGYLSDTITNHATVALFTGFGSEFKAFKRLTESLAVIRQKTWDLSSRLEAIQGLFMLAIEFGIFYIGVTFWESGKFTIGDFALIQAYTMQIFNRLWDIGRSVQRLSETMSDANEMTEILNTPHEVKDVDGAVLLRVPHGAIQFDQVSFAYPNGKPVFRKLSFVVAPHEKLALVGASGGGKSTIVKLLLRLSNVAKGKILIDGQDVALVTQESLRDAIALVPQEPLLFHRSLLENIRYGKKRATVAEVVAASKLAHCHEFIERLPQGYKTYVGERGVKLSGGERQRVAIARAILKNAPILILDEATSSLDSESEFLIQDALKNLMHKKTAIVIAHRLSTIMQMDRIMVLDRGKVIEEGTHAQLVKVKEGVYQKLWHIQAGGFSS